MKKLLYLFLGMAIAQLTISTNTIAGERLPFEPEMVKLEGGTFQMGCVSGKGCQPDELPVHAVTIQSFEMGKYEVTFDQWDECVKQRGCEFNPQTAWGRGAQPVIKVDWNETQEYINWLNKVTGRTYRLPTEAEWEYAARANTQTPFSTGECINTDQANYKGDRSWDAGNCPKTDKYRKQTTKVGSFSENGFGLFDMHGNLIEWVQDCYHRSYDGAPADGSAWETDCSVTRVLRGGKWSSTLEDLRSARRARGTPTRGAFKFGFRVARSM